MMQIFVKYKVLVSVLFYVLWGSDFFAQILELGEERTLVLNWISRAAIFIFWLIILVDMTTQKLKDKTFWIVSMFLLPFFAPVVYLFRRNKLLHLQNNMFRNG